MLVSSVFAIAIASGTYLGFKYLTYKEYKRFESKTRDGNTRLVECTLESQKSGVSNPVHISGGIVKLNENNDDLYKSVIVHGGFQESYTTYIMMNKIMIPQTYYYTDWRQLYGKDFWVNNMDVHSSNLHGSLSDPFIDMESLNDIHIVPDYKELKYGANGLQETTSKLSITRPYSWNFKGYSIKERHISNKSKVVMIGDFNEKTGRLKARYLGFNKQRVLDAFRKTHYNVGGGRIFAAGLLCAGSITCGMMNLKK
jgi:hypothetical protein